MAKNPWNRQRLESFIGQEEGDRLEFKSSRDLLKDSSTKFISDLTHHVSAFLNSDGGLLIIGIEEAPTKDKKRVETAIRLSDGVPRSRFTGARLASAICDQIHPSVANYVRVLPVVVDEANGEDQLAFVIEVTPGITAYQAADKLYYARRSFSSEAMEDKDIRLRMLADEKPRADLEVGVVCTPTEVKIDDLRLKMAVFMEKKGELLRQYGNVESIPPEDLKKLIFERPTKPMSVVVTVRLLLLNIGLVTISRGAYKTELQIDEGTLSSNIGFQTVTESRFQTEGIGPLYPEMQNELRSWNLSFRINCPLENIDISLKAIVFLDNGLAVRKDFDLSDQVVEAVRTTFSELDQLFATHAENE